jgi:hypothetical protein
MRPKFPFWAGFPYLSANLLASRLSGKSNREIRRGSRFLDRRLVLDQRCPKTKRKVPPRAEDWRSPIFSLVGMTVCLEPLGRDDSSGDGIGDRWSW